MTVAGYQLTWITPYLAVGYAPMSYAELDSIKEQGIDAIVNLCGEYCDLHEIEEKSGFEVYFLPIPDENAPDMEEMEKALEWLDEAIYLGKKVLVHCRHGVGRTGTFVTAYLLRKGLGLKVAGKTLKHTRATPTNYAQWRLLRKYDKRSGRLTIREPSLESQHVVDLSEFFDEYQALVQEVEERIGRHAAEAGALPRCGRDTTACCRQYRELRLIEAIYLTNHMNRLLKSDERQGCVNRAVALFQQLRRKAREQNHTAAGDGGPEEMARLYREIDYLCPLSREEACLLYDYRPLGCRLHGVPAGVVDEHLVEDVLVNISRNVFYTLSGVFPGREDLSFSMLDTISGRFVQIYFHYLASLG